jgi:hypothetical protein
MLLIEDIFHESHSGTTMDSFRNGKRKDQELLFIELKQPTQFFQV